MARNITIITIALIALGIVYVILTEVIDLLSMKIMITEREVQITAPRPLTHYAISIIPHDPSKKECMTIANITPPPFKLYILSFKKDHWSISLEDLIESCKLEEGEKATVEVGVGMKGSLFRRGKFYSTSKEITVRRGE